MEEQNDEMSANIAETIRILREENERLKDQVFELKEEPNPISDSSINQAYTHICDAIEGWIDGLISTADAVGIDFRSHNRRVLRNRKQRSVLKNTGLDLDSLADHDSADYFVLSLLIAEQLAEQIFSNPYPIGITISQMKVLGQIESGMKSPILKKDQLSMDKWRMESLTALTADPSFKQQQSATVKKIVQKAMDVMSPWMIDNRAVERLKASLQREIFDPAVRLHQAMRTSINRYEMQRPVLSSNANQDEKITSWTLKDIGTWRTRVKRMDEISEFIYCLYPSVVRLGVRGEAEVEVVKPVVVVTLALSSPSVESTAVALQASLQTVISLRAAEQGPGYAIVHTKIPKRARTSGWQESESEASDSPGLQHDTYSDSRRQRYETHHRDVSGERRQSEPPGKLHSSFANWLMGSTRHPR